MWRPTFAVMQKVIMPSLRKNVILSKMLFSTGRRPYSLVKITMASASVGILMGAGWGGYTHYKVNAKKRFSLTQEEEYPLLKEPPVYQHQYKVIYESDASNLQLILFQYKTCPFCCKVRAYLDSRGISYEVVEVDAVLRQAIKWSSYKKVPILLAKVDGGYLQLLDSTAIISAIETYLQDKCHQLRDVIKFYPITKYNNEEGKETTEIANKYFIMHNAPAPDEKERNAEKVEREWRQWADKVLVHTLSPNVYRTPSEALETFKWFAETGRWRESFPSWECHLMIYGGSAAMWVIAKRLKARHHIDDARAALYDAANKWIKAVKNKGSRFLGGDQPNLADISVYGVLSSIEGCRAFQDLRSRTDIGRWYDDMTNTIHQKQSKLLTAHAAV